MPPIRHRVWLLAPLVALALAWPVGSAGPAPKWVPPTAPAQQLTGALVLCGGGPVSEEVRKTFLDLAGGAKAKLVLVDGATDAALDPWKQLGPASVVRLHVADQNQANDPNRIKPLTEATGVWLGGDDPEQLAALGRDTAFHKGLKGVLARGGVIGGGPAGTAMMSVVTVQGHRGFGLLPGAVIDGQFLRRNHFTRLQRALASHPGLFGLGIDGNTAAVVKGRRLGVVGESYVVTCEAPSPNRSENVQILHPGDTADLIALSRSALARAAGPWPPPKFIPPVLPSGTLVIVGGGGMPHDGWKRFIDAAGGPNAPIVVIPTAMGDPLPRLPGEALGLRRAGAKNVTVLHTRSRTEANAADFEKPLKDAKGVWFGGGRQWRFVDSYEGTGCERLFHDVLKRGGVIGGSSAGASIQGMYMCRGNPLGNFDIAAEGYERGFDFLPGSAIDQHFFRRNRVKDMQRLIATYPQLFGLGLDEATAVIVHGRMMDVIGRSKVAVFDPRRRQQAGAKGYEELSAGMQYDLAAGRPLMGAGK